MRAGHRENMRRAINQIGGERLTALLANIHAFRFANLNGVKARRLSAHRVNTRGSNFNVLAIADQTAKQTFRDGTAANIASANEEDAFHGGARARERGNKIRSNQLIVDLRISNSGTFIILTTRSEIAFHPSKSRV
jgi:hypothetical protein